MERSSGVWVIGADGKGAQRVLDGAQDPVWSPDGQRLALTTPTGAAVVRLGNMSIKRFAGASRPHWSAAGQLELLVQEPDGWLSVENEDGTRRRVALATPFDAAFSPDGRFVAFGRGRSIFVVPADGSAAPVEVAADDSGYPGDWSWSPDSQELVYTHGPHGGATEIATLSRNGDGARDVTRTVAAPSLDAVEVRTSSGRLVAPARTRAHAVLLSRQRLVDLTEEAAEVRDPRTAALLRTVPLQQQYPRAGSRPGDAVAVSLTGRWLAYSTWDSDDLRLIDLDRGRRTSVHGAAPDVGPVASGRRHVWATVGNHARITTMVLPR